MSLRLKPSSWASWRSGWARSTCWRAASAERQKASWRRSFRQAAESGHPEPLTAGALTLYPRWFPTQFGFVAGLLVLLGLGVAARRRHWLLLAALLPALMLLELLQNKNLRYTLPLLPVAAVLAGFGFGALAGRLKAGAGGLLLVAGVM